MTEKENYMLAFKGLEHPWVPQFRKVAEWIRPDFLMGADPVTQRNVFGIKYATENDNGRIPLPNDFIMTDVSQWRDIVKFVDLDQVDWKKEAARVDAQADPNKARMVSIGMGGLFLTMINMMGWVEGLCAILEDTDAVEDFCSGLADYYVKLAKYEMEYYKPDILMMSDDISCDQGPFVSQEIFRRLYRPYYQKIIDVVKAEGYPVEFHCCGYCKYLLEEFVEMKIDSIQIPRPYEDVKALKKKYGNKIVLCGGWDWQSPGGLPNASEEVVRAEVRKVIDTFATDPAYVFWDGDAVGTSPDMLKKVEWIRDEVDIYGHKALKA
jgi:hypothetical protein